MTREEAYKATENGPPSDVVLKKAFHDVWGNAKDKRYDKEALSVLQYLLNKRGILV